MNLPLIRHQSDRANCFLHRRSFPQEAEESVCGAAGSSTSEGETEDVAARPARSDAAICCGGLGGEDGATVVAAAKL